MRPISSLDEFREDRALEAKTRFDQAWSNRAQDWRALERALDDLDVAVCALVSAGEGPGRATSQNMNEDLL